MSQRESGYFRIEKDDYATPEWVTRVLVPHIPRKKTCLICEPALGAGKLADELARCGYIIESNTDPNYDFLKDCYWHDAIVTNPPYSIADEFITHSLLMTKALKGFVAMLLRTDFDHANSRRKLFADHPHFMKKIVLTRRIRWFEHSTGSPSFNHAWFIWDWTFKGEPTLAYGP